MHYLNEIVSINISQDDVTEPVTRSEVKAHLRIDSTDDDLYLDSLITYARQIIENYTYTSLVEKEITLTIAFKNRISGYNSYFVEPFYFWTELPYGPVQSIDDVLDKQEQVITEDRYYTRGNGFMQWSGNFTEPITITYTAGYETLPPQLKLALLSEIAFRYENRGEAEAISKVARTLAHPYKRYAWL